MLPNNLPVILPAILLKNRKMIVPLKIAEKSPKYLADE